MVADYSKYVAFRCPDCAKTVIEKINLFDFSGGACVDLICDCMAQCVEILPLKGKYRINVYCPVCLDTHSFTFKSKAFWNKRVTTFSCPVVQTGIISIGDRDIISEQLRKQNEQIDRLFDEIGLSSVFSEDSFKSDEVMLQVIDRIHVIASGGDLYCTCGGRDISFRVNYDSVELMCRKCGALEKIAAATENDLIGIMSRSRIAIKSPMPKPGMKNRPRHKKGSAAKD